VNQDTAVYSNKADEISSLNIQIKDAITEVQVDTEEIEKQASQGAKQKSQYENAIKTANKILTLRLHTATCEFKNFLQKHQKNV
jgi:predicted ferric reductase